MRNVSLIVNRVSYLPLVFIIPGIFGGYILREELLTVFFGAEFTPAATVLIILLIGKLVQSYHITVGRTLSAMDLPNLAMRSRLISIPANVILNFLLIPILGINGAAIASVASICINLTTNYRYLTDYFEIEIPWMKVGWMLFSSCCMFGAVLLAKGQLAVSGYVSLLSLVLLGALVYVGLLTFPREMRTTLQEFVRMEIS